MYVVNIFNKLFWIICKFQLEVLILNGFNIHALSPEIIGVVICPFNVKHHILFRFHVNEFPNHFLFYNTSKLVDLSIIITIYWMIYNNVGRFEYLPILFFVDDFIVNVLDNLHIFSSCVIHCVGSKCWLRSQRDLFTAMTIGIFQQYVFLFLAGTLDINFQHFLVGHTFILLNCLLLFFLLVQNLIFLTEAPE